MSKPRDNSTTQHHYNFGHYGELPLNSLPSGNDGDILYFQGTALSGSWIVTPLSGLASMGSGSSPYQYIDTTSWRLKDGITTLYSPDETSYIYFDSNYVEIGDGAGYIYLDGTVGVFFMPEGFVWSRRGSDPVGEPGQAYYNNATHHFRGNVSGSWVNLDDDKISSAAIVIDNGVSVITTGVKADIPMLFNCTITGVELLANVSGSIVVDIWKNTYANYPPIAANSITASAKPTLSSAIKSLDTTLTGWNTAITAGDTLRFNVDSASTVNRVTVALKLRRT